MMRSGKLDRISDVPGVTVGHCSVISETHRTGATVVMPCPDNPFTGKLPCASFVLNGFGKTAGLVQIEELGTLETPIALTNTLGVGRIHDALVGYMVELCAKENVRVRSINPVVAECNDSYLNEITDRCLGEEHLRSAIDNACAEFEMGDVGAGSGMTCHGLKGGIGSASAVIEADGREYTLGVLVMTNHGRLSDLTIEGENIGQKLEACIQKNEPDKGSCIIVLATDLPLSDRQLHRVLRRCSVGLARLGSYIGHGSGEVFIGFSTANRIYEGKNDILSVEQLREERIDSCFRAAAECTERAVLKSLRCAHTVTGRDGHRRISLNDAIKMTEE